EILDREIGAGGMEDNAIKLRVYLCLTLGEFKVADGLPALVKAATTARSEKESDVRRAAVEGIALLAAGVGPRQKAFFDKAQLADALMQAAVDPDPRTRSVAAVALGTIGAPAMLDKLRFMLEDTHPDVRYNAAARLAQQGDAAAVDTLVEML